MRRRHKISPMNSVDYDGDIAFVAMGVGTEHQLWPRAHSGYLRIHNCQVSMLVRSDMQRRGLGRALLLIDARATGLHELIGQMLPDNQAMIALARRCGMEVEHVESAESSSHISTCAVHERTAAACLANESTIAASSYSRRATLPCPKEINAADRSG